MIISLNKTFPSSYDILFISPWYLKLMFHRDLSLRTLRITGRGWAIFCQKKIFFLSSPEEIRLKKNSYLLFFHFISGLILCSTQLVRYNPLSVHIYLTGILKYWFLNFWLTKMLLVFILRGKFLWLL